MKTAVKIFLIIVTFSPALAYIDIDDNYDYNSMFKNKTQLHEFMGCFLDENPCTVTEKHIKDHIKQAVATLCANCDDIQRHYARLMDKAMSENYPAEYEEYKAKYDPSGKHYALFQKALLKY